MLTDVAFHPGSLRRWREEASPPPQTAGLSEGLSHYIDCMGLSRSFTRDMQLYGEDDPSEFIYKVVAGNVRAYKILLDGRRQIGAFYLPGDIFGLETEPDHVFSTEAVSDATVLILKRSVVMQLAMQSSVI